MSKYNFDILANRKNTNCVKYDAFSSTLPMWVADMDFMMAPKIKEAIQKDLDVGAIGYSLIPDEFYQSFIDIYKRRYNAVFSKDDMAYVSGVVAAIDSMLKSYCNKGDSVIMLTPIYHTFFSCIKGVGLNVLPSIMKYDGENYEINFEDLEEKMSLDNSKVLLLCNPHNPVGKIFSIKELKEIDRLATKHNVLVVSDEIHGLLTNPNKKYHPYCSVISSDNFVMCLATSKAFNLAGLQSAVIVCKNHELLKRFQDAFYTDDIGEPNYFAVNANIAALRDSEDWLDELNEYIYQNKIYFKSFIERNVPQLSVILTEATYMVWVDISLLSDNSELFVKRLNEETGLLVSPGKQFGPGGEGFFRINLATSIKNVNDACARLKKFVDGK